MNLLDITESYNSFQKLHIHSPSRSVTIFCELTTMGAVEEKGQGA